MSVETTPTEITDYITLQIPVPAPGRTIECEVDGLEITVVNTNEGPEDDGFDVDITEFVPVYNKSMNGSTVHAAVLGGQVKRRRASYTLCSQNKSRPSGRQLRNLSLEDVTCTQCRNRLVRAGALAGE